MTGDIDADDVAFFERQRLQAQLAHAAIREGRVRPGRHGTYVAFHDGKVLATAEQANPLHSLHSDVAPADLYITFLPGRDDVLAYG